MVRTLFEIVFSGTGWVFRSPFRTTEYPSKAEAIKAALRAARFKDEISLRILRPDGSVESEIDLKEETQKPNRTPVHELDRGTARSIRFYADKPASLIDRRLEELSKEVPLETLIYGHGTLLTLVSLAFVLFGRKKLGIAGIIVSVIQLQFFYQRRNPVVLFLRRKGFRSEREIQAEKFSLEALRGDFAVLNDAAGPDERARKCLGLFS